MLRLRDFRIPTIQPIINEPWYYQNEYVSRKGSIRFYQLPPYICQYVERYC